MEVVGPAPRLGYRPALDGLRTVAVGLVVAIHSIEILVPSLTHRLLAGGFLGVDLFFVLSGFLITTLLLEEHLTTGRLALGRFYARRGLRLIPAVVVVLACHVVWAVVTGVPRGDETESVAFVLLYVANWAFAAGHLVAPGLAHMWSLAVEEQFYLLWPLLLLLLLRFLPSRRALIAGLVIGVLASVVLSAVAWELDPNWRHLYVRTDLRVMTLLTGALLAVVLGARPLPSRLVWSAAVVGWVVYLVSAQTMNLTTAWFYQGGSIVVAIAAAAMVAGVVSGDGPGNAVLASRPLVFLGRRSYGIYLWHLPVIVAVAHAGASWPPGLRVLVALSVTLAATVLSFRYVETPFLRLKRRFAAPTPEASPAACPLPAPTGGLV